jgi:hypothetical protein
MNIIAEVAMELSHIDNSAMQGEMVKFQKAAVAAREEDKSPLRDAAVNTAAFHADTIIKMSLLHSKWAVPAEDRRITVADCTALHGRIVNGIQLHLESAREYANQLREGGQVVVDVEQCLDMAQKEGRGCKGLEDNELAHQVLAHKGPERKGLENAALSYKVAESIIKSMTSVGSPGQGGPPPQIVILTDFDFDSRGFDCHSLDHLI